MLCRSIRIFFIRIRI